MSSVGDKENLEQERPKRWLVGGGWSAAPPLRALTPQPGAGPAAGHQTRVGGAAAEGRPAAEQEPIAGASRLDGRLSGHRVSSTGRGLRPAGGPGRARAPPQDLAAARAADRRAIIALEKGVAFQNIRGCEVYCAANPPGPHRPRPQCMEKDSPWSCWSPYCWTRRRMEE